MSRFHVGIAGAGPGGLVAAIAARRVGFEVEIFERATAFTRIGGGVGIQSNGLRVLDAIGVLERARPALHLSTGATLWSPPGRVLSRADFREIAIPHSGFGVMLRFELQEILVAALADLGVAIRFGARVAGIGPDPSAPELILEGGERRGFDAVLACDGVHSAVRDALGLAVRKRVVGEAYLRTVSHRAVGPETPVGEMWAADGRRLGLFPLTDDRAYLFCSVPLGQWPRLREQDPRGWIARWSDFGPEVTATLEAVDWNAAVYDELQDLRVEPWHRGAIFVAGDAAHAMTPNLGQGANSAMVDALVLVRLLDEACREGSDLSRVGVRYEAIRRPFVTRIQDSALRGGEAASWTSAPARSLRDSAIRLTNRIAPLRRASLRLIAGWNPVEAPFLDRPLATPGFAAAPTREALEADVTRS